MRSNLVSYVILIALSSLPNHIAANNRIIVDQQQPRVDLSVGGLAIGGDSQQMLAQTVTVGRGGKLIGVSLPIGCDSGALVIEVRTLEGDQPGALVLRQRRFTPGEIPSLLAGFPFFRLGDGLSFAKGDRFALVFRNPTGSCGIFQAPGGDTYTAGEAFFDARPNQPGWVRFSDTQTAVDLPFKTWVE